MNPVDKTKLSFTVKFTNLHCISIQRGCEEMSEFPKLVHVLVHPLVMQFRVHSKKIITRGGLKGGRLDG